MPHLTLLIFSYTHNLKFNWVLSLQFQFKLCLESLWSWFFFWISHGFWVFYFFAVHSGYCWIRIESRLYLSHHHQWISEKADLHLHGFLLCLWHRFLFDIVFHGHFHLAFGRLWMQNISHSLRICCWHEACAIDNGDFHLHNSIGREIDYDEGAHWISNCARITPDCSWNWSWCATISISWFSILSDNWNLSFS